MTEGPEERRTRGRLNGVAGVVGWIGVGSVTLAAIMLAADSFVSLPVNRPVAIGLGLALGGGLGAVANLLQDGETATQAEEPLTATTQQSTPQPQPEDLFDGHPDPVIYYADAGHGPVARAVNEAFGETFAVPTDRLAGTPLSEALLVTGDSQLDAETIVDGDVDTRLTCETADGESVFRLRTVGSGTTGYLLYTPVSSAAD